MKITKMKVTPEMATKWLENNGSNRPLRKSLVDYIVKEFAQGKWSLTHQGIAIAKNGVLLDGQHRLYAIVQSGLTVEMWVATDVPFDSALNFPVDNGQKRTISDVMGFSKDKVALINGLIGIVTQDPARRFSTAEREAVLRVFEDSIDVFLTTCSKFRKQATSVKFKAPVFIHWLLSGDCVSQQYNAFCSLDETLMSPRVIAFHRLMVRDEKLTKGDSAAVIAKVWTAFDPTKANQKRFVAIDVSANMTEMRNALAQLGLTAELHKLGNCRTR